MGHHVLADVQDKVVQDTDDTEGTGIWSNNQATSLHVPAPTLSTAHYLRIASGDRAQREHVKRSFHGSFLPSKIEFQDKKERDEYLEDLRTAVYTTCLASYIQGMNIINVADRQNQWSIDYKAVVQIWRAGCIIRCDHIADILEPIMEAIAQSKKLSDHNLLYRPRVVEDLRKGFPSLIRVVMQGTESNAVICSISATLDYLKYAGNLQLPAQFHEAELDYFGKHMFDKKGEGEGAGEPKTGSHHYEWKPA